MDHLPLPRNPVIGTFDMAFGTKPYDNGDLSKCHERAGWAIKPAAPSRKAPISLAGETDSSKEWLLKSSFRRRCMWASFRKACGLTYNQTTSAGSIKRALSSYALLPWSVSWADGRAPYAS